MDVKPQNFVQVGGGQYRTTWVAIDFDLAHDLVPSLLPPDYCSVTWDYCPPEFACVGGSSSSALAVHARAVRRVGAGDDGAGGVGRQLHL
jgi:hypothetical protein